MMYAFPVLGHKLNFATEPEKEAVVEVADNGVGIPEDAVSHIFERFYRLDPSRTKDAQTITGRIQGTGLGLSIAKEIVENHHGRIIVRSEAGKGSAFSIHLPRAI